MTSKQIKIPEDKPVSITGTVPPISNRVDPKGPEFLFSSGYTGCFMRTVLPRGFLNYVLTKSTDPLKRLCKASFIVCHSLSVSSFPQLLWAQYQSTSLAPWVQLYLKTSQQLASEWLCASLSGMMPLQGSGPGIFSKGCPTCNTVWSVLWHKGTSASLSHQV